MAVLPATMPVGPKGQSDWIKLCALELAALVREMPYPVAYLASMHGETLRAFGHSIYNETQLSVIRQHTAHTDRQLRERCAGWAATADGHSG